MPANKAIAKPPPVKVVLYKWAGKWGPFKVRIPCGECALTQDILRDTFAYELAGVPIDFVIKDWLSNWWKPLPKGGWHAPIVMVEGRIISQGHALNRGILAEAVIQAYVKRSSISGNHIFGKATCPHCVGAKHALGGAGIPYAYHDVVRDPRALYEMVARVKPNIGHRTPLTVPQIWLDGQYVGGADALERRLSSAGMAGSAPVALTSPALALQRTCP